MLLTSPEEGSSSLPTSSLPPFDSYLDEQSGVEGDRAISTAPLDTIVDGDRTQSEQDEPSPTCSSLDSNAVLTSSGIHTNGANPLTQLPHRQPARSKVPLQESERAGLYALQQVAGLGAWRRSRTSVWSKSAPAKLTEANTSESSNLVSFAAPLSPLRERDLTALSELFLRDDIYAIEADVKQRLLSLLPEPCWEDDVFDFLKEFL